MELTELVLILLLAKFVFVNTNLEIIIQRLGLW